MSSNEKNENENLGSAGSEESNNDSVATNNLEQSGSTEGSANTEAGNEGYNPFANSAESTPESTAEVLQETLNEATNTNTSSTPSIVANESPQPTPEPLNNYSPTVLNITGTTEEQPHLDQPYDDTQAQRIASQLIHQYFTTQNNPLTRHHLESFDQFLQRDFLAILKANPIRLLKNPKEFRGRTNLYKYTVNIFIGGQEHDKIRIGTPTIILKKGKERDIRILYPNEARLRNLTYTCPILADILIRIDIVLNDTTAQPEKITKDIEVKDYHLMNMPLMLHSKYCILHDKPQALLQEMGECPQDPGGYFIINGSEKVLVTSQEQSFNTLWMKEQPADEACQYYGNISCLNPETREVRPVSFYWTREKLAKTRGFDQEIYLKESVLEVGIPQVFKPIPIFVLFRALGVQTDKDILQLIFPDLDSPEANYLSDLLIPSINAAMPFYDTYTSIQYIKLLTKNMSVYSVLDVLHHQLFPHVEDKPGNRAQFLAECVRKILRIVKGLEQPASRDDTRNQRLLTSGFLIQQLFQQAYKTYVRKVMLNIDNTFSYNESIYKDENFVKMFEPGNINTIFSSTMLSDSMLKGFKGKWQIGVSKEADGVLQELSRLSYIDFISHLRRAVLDFDTSIKLQGPRRLNPSQYGYFCTSETPSGANIGVVKNLSIMTAISTSMIPTQLIQWLTNRANVIPVEYMTPETMKKRIPVYVNVGIIGYTENPNELVSVLRSMKRTGCLPPLTSITFSIPSRRVDVYTDEGRPCRPLIACETRGKLPPFDRFGSISDKGEGKSSLHFKTWRELVVGTLVGRAEKGDQPTIHSRKFIDPLKDQPKATLPTYIEFFNREEVKAKMGVIEYLDPYEHNEALVANSPTQVLMETTHMEVHPSTILGLLGNSIPFLNHNQSPRNQLGSSQSKQSLSIYATNWKNRFDNTANVLCYGEAPLTRTLYQDYYGDGQMSYGQNIILAIGMYGGYNQEDGIIMNADALARGQFRSLNYRSYETFEEDDEVLKLQTRVANPAKIPAWLDLRPQLDYSKLDDSGIVKVGTYVDQTTVIVGKYQIGPDGELKDASLTPQVWTSGRVESVVVTLNNIGLKLVKIRVVHDRVPQLGDKFSNRHGQKGTANIFYRGHDMPRTVDGITPDMIMNPTAIPSRMTIGQILEQLFGLAAASIGGIANGTAFMNSGSPHEAIGNVLEKVGLQRMGNHILYNGMTGEQIKADIFMGCVYGMRLKHMTDDKWNARGQGRKEMRTRQPTGGRGNEGGLKIGEMDRDAILAHGVASFLKESMMERSDASTFVICNGCGTLPFYNERKGFYMCPLCDGPIRYVGDTVNTLEPVLPVKRSQATFSKIAYPYASKLFTQELETFLNIGTRILTTSGIQKLHGMDTIQDMPGSGKVNVSQPLEPIRYAKSEIPVGAPVQPPPAPTSSELEALTAQLGKAQEKAVVTFQAPQGPVDVNTALEMPSAVPSPAPVPGAPNVYPPPGPALVPAQPQAPLNMGTNLLQGANSAIAAKEGPTLEATLSTVPAPVPGVVQNQPPEAPKFGGAGGATVDSNTTIPVISVDTGPEALLADGLKEEAQDSLPSPYDAAKQAQRSRKLPRRQQSPPRQQFQGPVQEPEDEEQSPAKSSAPVTVIKMG